MMSLVAMVHPTRPGGCLSAIHKRIHPSSRSLWSTYSRPLHVHIASGGGFHLVRQPKADELATATLKRTLIDRIAVG
jgi:hypothetical protein